MNDPTDRDREMAQEWLSDGHGDCYRYEPREDEAGRTVDSLAALIARAREEGRREEEERCMKAVCDGCANGDEYAEGYHHYGLGNKRVCHAAALREGSEPTKSGGRE